MLWVFCSYSLLEANIPKFLQVYITKSKGQNHDIVHLKILLFFNHSIRALGKHSLNVLNQKISFIFDGLLVPVYIFVIFMVSISCICRMISTLDIFTVMDNCLSAILKMHRFYGHS